jgi:hypothetical protein
LMLIKVPSRFHGAKEERTERIGGPSFGRMRHWQPVRWLSSRALTIARQSISVGWPPLGDGVTTSGAMAAHCASVRLDRIDVHVVAYQIAPSQNGMATIMIPHIRFSDRPLNGRVGQDGCTAMGGSGENRYGHVQPSTLNSFPAAAER